MSTEIDTMDKYSRLLVYFSSIGASKKDDDVYPNIVSDVSVLQNPSEELSKIIRDDLATILPAILILSVHNDVGIRTAIEKTFNTFTNIISKFPNKKNESWWKDMETRLITT